MYRLFTKKPFRGLRISQKFIRAKIKYEDSLVSAIDYYQRYDTYLSNQHILVRLISGLIFDPETPQQDLYRQTERRTTRICSGLGLTSDVTPGRFFKKSFYTSNCAVIAVNYSDPLNIPHWKHIRAVRPLTHPHVTLKLVLPNRLRSVNDEDYSVVGIDIPLLTVQYQGWVLEEFTKPQVEREDITQFIMKWVLPGMLPEQIDISMRNRIQHLAAGTWREEPNIKPPLHLVTFDKEFDRAFQDQIKFYRTGMRTMSEVMIGMPMFSEESYWTAVPQALKGLNIYNYWVSLLVYTDWIYPIAIGFRVDPRQELVDKNLLKVNRYVTGSRASKFITGSIEEAFHEKYRTLIMLWTNLTGLESLDPDAPIEVVITDDDSLEEIAEPDPVEE